MGKSEYLKSILANRAIVPRYCMENIEYLNIRIGDVCFKEVAILQKCFCDIPFHKLTDNFELNGVGEVYKSLSEMKSIMNHKEEYEAAITVREYLVKQCDKNGGNVSAYCPCGAVVLIEKEFLEIKGLKEF